MNVLIKDKNANGLSKDALQRENQVLKAQIQELLRLDDAGVFIELDSLIHAILKKTLVLCKAKASFFSVTPEDPCELDIRVCEGISNEQLNTLRRRFQTEYKRWLETESAVIEIGDFVLLPLTRRHKMLGVIGLRLDGTAPENICEMLPILASQAAVSLENAILYERMFKRLLVLSNVFILGKEIILNLDLAPLVEKFLSIACDGTKSELVCIYLFREREQKPYFYKIFASAKHNLEFYKSGYSSLIANVRAEKKYKIIDPLTEKSEYAAEINKIKELQIYNTLVMPLMARDKLIGVIQVANRLRKSAYCPEDADLLQILASQLAFVIQNAELFNNLQRAYLDTLSALTGAIDAKDSYTRGHSERVTNLSLRLAAEMGFANDDIKKIKLGALLHDIGKIGINEAILNKPGKLSDSEYEAIKTHPDLGVRILGRVEFLEEIVPIIRHHHERFDGKGYPDRLAGHNIPMLARIVSVADTYDAMTTNRPYRKALSIKQALEEIKRCAGSQFDPEAAEHFIKMINLNPKED